MREVLFKRFIPKMYENGRLVPGTGMVEYDYTQNGIFHQWGCSFQEFESGPANFTVALVEIEDGSIVEIEPCRIKFIQS